MNSPCAECDRPAVSYWGTAAYCLRCLAKAKADDPKAHCCPECGEEQPVNVSWHATAPCGTCQATRRQKRLDPRWQRKRLEILDRDGWRCVACSTTTSTLHVHHIRYGAQLWDGAPEDFQTLCEECHSDLGPHPRGGVFWKHIASRNLTVFRAVHCPKCAASLPDGPDGERCEKCGHHVTPRYRSRSFTIVGGRKVPPLRQQTPPARPERPPA